MLLLLECLRGLLTDVKLNGTYELKPNDPPSRCFSLLSLKEQQEQKRQNGIISCSSQGKNCALRRHLPPLMVCSRLWLPSAAMNFCDPVTYIVFTYH